MFCVDCPTIPWQFVVRAILTFPPAAKPTTRWKFFRAGEIPPKKGNTGPMIFLNYVSWPLFSLFSLPRLHGRKYDAVLCYNTSPVLMSFPAIVYAKLHKIPLTNYVLDIGPENYTRYSL